MTDAFLRGHPLALTPREFQLLSLLMDHPNQVVSNDRLLEVLWGTATVGDDHPIHVNISRLRTKLNADGESARMIRTIRGCGYMYAPPAPEPHIVHLRYDRHLILRAVEPADRPFLGWHPAEIVDTFFMLTSFAQVPTSRRVALAIARVCSSTGVDGWDGPMSARTGDGGIRVVNAEVRILTCNRRFRGIEAQIHL